MTDNDDRQKITMRSTSINPDGTPVTFEATDWVFPDDVDRYVADAQTRWQYVTVDADAVTPAAVLAGSYTAPLADQEDTI